MEIINMIGTVASTVCIVCVAIMAVWITGWFIWDAIGTWRKNHRRK